MKRITLAALLALAPEAGAQTLDRKAVPPAGPAPAITFPAVQQRTLANGLRVYVVERRNVPLATMRLVVDAGAAAEPAGRGGLALLTAEMLDEGTATRSALQIADELELLGAELSTSGGYDIASVTLNTLSRNVRPALGILADVVARPAFAAAELERVRGQRLTGLIQQQDQPVTLANREFAARVFGGAHPYGRPLEGTAETVRQLAPGDLRAFHQQFYRPGSARLIVVGDVRAAELIPQIETAFAGWTGGAAQPVSYPAAPQPQAGTRVYLIDKPGAAQSEVRIGHLGVARSHPDHFPLLVLNAILGGQFTSRINLNLRENKGYTYGARSGWTQRREPGPFTAQAGVQTPVTKESLVEFMRELEEIRGTRPVTEQELDFARASLIRSEPLRSETNAQIAARLEELVLYGLPMDYYSTYNQRIQAVTRDDVQRVAQRYLSPDKFAVVVVGDRSKVEAGLRELPYPVEIVNR
ncbi:MAG TPA: pitrilysin family protein [Longimicrobium sp.]|jgi:predicted Zn-dependent peptidase